MSIAEMVKNARHDCKLSQFNSGALSGQSESWVRTLEAGEADELQIPADVKARMGRVLHIDPSAFDKEMVEKLAATCPPEHEDHRDLNEYRITRRLAPPDSEGVALLDDRLHAVWIAAYESGQMNPELPAEEAYAGWHSRKRAGLT
jgi:hypothetical protein